MFAYLISPDPLQVHSLVKSAIFQALIDNTTKLKTPLDITGFPWPVGMKPHGKKKGKQMPCVMSVAILLKKEVRLLTEPR